MSNNSNISNMGKLFCTWEKYKTPGALMTFEPASAESGLAVVHPLCSNCNL